MPTTNKEASIVVLDHSLELIVGMTTLFAAYYLQRPTEWDLIRLRAVLKLKELCDKITDHYYDKAREWESRATTCAQWYNELRP